MHDFELHQFKSDINLVQFAIDRYGYQRDRRESSRASHVLRRAATNDKIVVRRAPDGHWTYFSVRDDRDHGTIIDFVQARGRHDSLGHVREELRQWLGTARPWRDVDVPCAPAGPADPHGMRTGDLHTWDWTMIDRVAFEQCTIPRAKTRAPQVLAIPAALAPFLRAWWERAGKPESGPVFPARVGKRAGLPKRPDTSYAERLRRALFRAGVMRMRPVQVPATRPGTRTDLGKSAEGTQIAPNPGDPLYFETATTLPVDFHSFRRAFNTALAGAGINVQRAMHLAGHSDAKTHMRYVMHAPAMRVIPAEALPQLPVSAEPFVSRSTVLRHRSWRRPPQPGLRDDRRSASARPMDRQARLPFRITGPRSSGERRVGDVLRVPSGV
jgi:hypothetical protein